MASHYNASLRAFVLAHHYMDSFTFHPISGRDIIRKFGYPQCSKSERSFPHSRPALEDG